MELLGNHDGHAFHLTCVQRTQGKDKVFDHAREGICREIKHFLHRGCEDHSKIVSVFILHKELTVTATFLAIEVSTAESMSMTSTQERSTYITLNQR